MFRKLASHGFVCMALTLGVPVFASSIVMNTYTDLTSWTNAVTEEGDVTFEGVAPAGGDDPFQTSAGYTNQGVNFVGINGSAFYEDIVDSTHGSGYLNWGSGASLLGYANYAHVPTPYIQVNLSANITAFSVNLAAYGVPGDAVQVQLSDGESFSVSTFSQPNLAFFGVTTSAPVSFIDFSVNKADGAQLLMDNFAFGSADTPTPEAETLVLIGLGLLCLTPFSKTAWRKQLSHGSDHKA